MIPILFTIPFIDFPIYSFGVMVLVGTMVGIKWAEIEARRRGLDGEEITGIAIEVFLAGLIGTRVFFIIQHWDTYWAKEGFDFLISLVNIREGGLVWYGGPIMALPVIYFRLKNYPVNPLVITDIWVPGLALGHTFGRLGCFLVGDDHGKIWHEETWFTVTFNSPDALVSDESFRGVPLLPSQPLMWFGIMVIFLILVSVRKRLAPHPGALPALYFTLYPVHRFLIEFVRGDPRGEIYGLPTSQFVSIIMFPLALGALIYFLTRPRYDGPGLGPPWQEVNVAGEGPAGSEPAPAGGATPE